MACVDCQWAQYPESYSFWRKALAWTVLCLLSVLLAAGCFLLWKCQASPYVVIRQPKLLWLVFISILSSLIVPLREVLSERMIPCPFFLASTYSIACIFTAVEFLRYIRIHSLHHLQRHARGLMLSQLDLPHGGMLTPQPSFRVPPEQDEGSRQGAMGGLSGLPPTASFRHQRLKRANSTSGGSQCSMDSDSPPLQYMYDYSDEAGGGLGGGADSPLHTRLGKGSQGDGIGPHISGGSHGSARDSVSSSSTLFTRLQLHTEAAQGRVLSIFAAVTLTVGLARTLSYPDVLGPTLTSPLPHYGCQYQSLDYAFLSMAGGLLMVVLSYVAYDLWRAPGDTRDEFGLAQEVLVTLAALCVTSLLLFVGKSVDSWQAEYLNSDYAVVFLHAVVLMNSILYPCCVAYARPQWALMMSPQRGGTAGSAGAEGDASYLPLSHTYGAPVVPAVSVSVDGAARGRQGVLERASQFVTQAMAQRSATVQPAPSPVAAAPPPGMSATTGNGSQGGSLVSAPAAPPPTGPSAGTPLVLEPRISTLVSIMDVVRKSSVSPHQTSPKTVGVRPDSSPVSVLPALPAPKGKISLRQYTPVLAGDGSVFAGSSVGSAFLQGGSFNSAGPGAGGRRVEAKQGSKESINPSGPADGSYVDMGAYGGSLVFMDALQVATEAHGAMAPAWLSLSGSLALPQARPRAGSKATAEDVDAVALPISAFSKAVLDTMSIPDGGAPFPASVRSVPAASFVGKRPSLLTGHDLQAVTCQLIYTTTGREYFSAALQRAFCLENLLFLLDALQYRRFMYHHLSKAVHRRNKMATRVSQGSNVSTGAQGRTSQTPVHRGSCAELLQPKIYALALMKARRIRQRYIDPKAAELCVNLPYKIASKVLAEIAAERATLSLFYEGEREIVALLARGPVVRFVMGPGWAAWQAAVVSQAAFQGMFEALAASGRKNGPDVRITIREGDADSSSASAPSSVSTACAPSAGPLSGLPSPPSVQTGTVPAASASLMSNSMSVQAGKSSSSSSSSEKSAQGPRPALSASTGRLLLPAVGAIEASGSLLLMAPTLAMLHAQSHPPSNT